MLVPIGPIVLPGRGPGSSAGTTPAYTPVLIDAAGEQTAQIFQAPKTGNIRRIVCVTGTVTTGGTLLARLETVNATGDPSGTLFGTNTSANLVIGSADDLVFKESADFTADAIVTRGDYLAAVIAWATPFVGNISRWSATPSWFFPYSDTFNTGAWVKNAALCAIGVKYADGTYEWCGSDAFIEEAANSPSVSSATTPDEVGNRFTPPVPMTLGGFWVQTNWVAGGDFDFVIYGADGVTPLSTTAVDAEKNLATNGVAQFLLAAPVTLTAGVTYRLVVKPGATALTVRERLFDNPAVLNTMELGTSFYKTSAKDPSGVGSWTDDTSRRVNMGLIVTHLDDGTGAGVAATIALVASVSTDAATTSVNGGASAAINTTGATLLVISVSWATNPVTISDSKGNTWIALTERAANLDRHRLYYCLNPTVGSGHTFSVTGTSIVAGWHVYAFSGVASYQTESGATAASGSPLACGSVTPSAAGALVITGLCSYSDAAEVDSVTPGFGTVAQIHWATGTQVNASAAYLVQGAASAINPTWAWTFAPIYICVGAAVFLPATVLAGGGGGSSEHAHPFVGVAV